MEVETMISNINLSPPQNFPLDSVLADAMLSTDLLGRWHIELEAEEQGFERSTNVEEFSEISAEAMTPEEALSFFQRKEVMLREDFEALADIYRPRSFTIAYVENLDILGAAKMEIEKFLVSGEGLGEFQATMDSLFSRMGVDQLTPHHIENVFRTNMQTAYNAGRWEALQDPEMAEFFPLYEYHAVDDDRLRPTHEAMNGKRFRRDDPIWDIWWPTNGYQ